MHRWLTLALALTAIAACREDDFTGPGPWWNPATTTFAPGLDVDLSQMTKTASGLYWQDLVTGAGGEALAGDLVAVDYTAWLPDGLVIGSSRAANQQLAFRLGEGQVIPGLDEGIAGMRAGGVRKLVIPPDLAYGSSGIDGRIPPSSTLVFDVELAAIIDGSTAGVSP